MTKQELRLQARKSRLDDLTAPYLWSDSELNDYIDQAIDEAAIRARLITDSTTAKCCLITTKTGVASYALHPSVFQIKRVFDVQRKCVLKKTGIAFDDSFLNEGVSCFYTLEEDSRRITLYPTPSAVMTLKLTVYRTPLEILDDDGEPELPASCHNDLLDFVCHLAYLKPDADTFSPTESEKYEAAFTRAFGEKQEARKLEWRRKHREPRGRGRANFF